MTRPRVLGALSLFAVLDCSSLAAASFAAVRDPSCGEMRVALRENVAVYALPHRFLRAGSDSVHSRATPWQRGVDYALDRVRGELRLLRVPVAGETLIVSACWLLEPPPLELSLLRYRPARAAPPESASSAPAGVAGQGRAGSGFERARAWKSTESEGGASLALRGNKTIAVDFGSNQDAFLRQSLDLAVSGTLAPGVELTGVLSDRNTPLSAAGSTQDLAALDRVLIELKAPQGAAALGDVGLLLDQGEFARVERRLQGMRGEWSAGGFTGAVAAASAPGEFHRLQFLGVEGRQGPYLLTDRDGGSGIAVVQGSEVVTVDGVRMTRGESADYAIDYERARVTFSNRRPITAASRITVEYQYAVNRYKRNLVAGGGRWKLGNAFAFAQTLSEGDDRGRPLDLSLSDADRRRLEAAGDSARFAFGEGVVPGAGDYDTLRVDSLVVFVFAGRDSGRFAVQFARVPEGAGEYSDAGIVDGRAVYHYVGPGKGAYKIGRPLPLPESHRLVSVGGGVRAGPLSLELEGAVSHLDRNLFSRQDDRDDRGEAGRLKLELAGKAPGPWRGNVGLEVQARAVGERFAPFGRLERPFAEESWGLPLSADLEHQRRVGVSGFYRPGGGGELRAGVARLTAPGGFAALRREVEWSRDGTLSSHVHLERADGEQRARAFPEGGRERARGSFRLRLPWIEPALRGESDIRRSPSDTGRVGDRAREAGIEVGSGRLLSWRMLGGVSLRRDARESQGAFVDQSETRTLNVSLDSPTGRPLGLVLLYRRRDLVPRAAPTRTRSDLGSLRLSGQDHERGLNGQVGVEITAEGENRRERRLVFVGQGRGGYDALGNFVGLGDHDLVVTVSPELDRLARTATSVLLGWQFGQSAEWRGSRVQFDFESEARRLGEVRLRDPVVSPGAVRGDAGLARGSVLQRLETDVAPGSRAAAVRLRAERRVTADRSFANFAQSQDDRSLAARWRARPSASWTSELEARWRRQEVEQSMFAGASYARVLLESGGVAQLVYTPDSRLRGAVVVEGASSRPESRAERTLTIKVGPDLGLAVGERGRTEFMLRRAFVSGAPAIGLLPSADPVEPPRWEGSARLDYRLRESIHGGLSLTGRDRPGHKAQVTGRVELRAFF